VSPSAIYLELDRCESMRGRGRKGNEGGGELGEGEGDGPFSLHPSSFPFFGGS